MLLKEELQNVDIKQLEIYDIVLLDKQTNQFYCLSPSTYSMESLQDDIDQSNELREVAISCYSSPR